MACHQYILEQLKIIHQETGNNDVESQKRKRFKSGHSSILEDFEDEPEATDDDGKSVEFSSPITQS
ncbi:unnamed protein product, partial [Rotaria sp. Silwood1]